MKKVLMIFGYKYREYEYLNVLKSFLIKRGFAVKIRFMHLECFHDVSTWKPDFVFLNQVNQNENIELAKFAKRSGAKIIVLNAELLYTNKSIRTKYAPGCNEYVDYTIETGGPKTIEFFLKYTHLAS